jgi:methyl-accepting chemotaxis protein
VRILERRLASVGVRSSILVVVVAAVTVAALVGIIGLVQLTAVARATEAMYQRALVPAADVADLREAVWRFRYASLSAATAGTPEAAAKYREQTQAEGATIDKVAADYRTRQLSAEQRTAIDAFDSSWKQYLEARTRADELRAAGKMAEFEAWRAEKVTPTANQALERLDALTAVSRQTAQRSLVAAERGRDQARAAILVVVAAGVVVVLAIGLLIAQAILRPLRRVRDVLAAVAQGDLTQEVTAEGTNELGQMAAGLREAIDRTRAAVRTLASSSGLLGARADQLESASWGLVDGAGRTAGEISKISGSSNEVSFSVQAVATSAEEMEASIREIAVSTSRAATVAAEAVDASGMAEQIMIRLGSSSAEIGDVIKVITAIAEQTNLLALNATIEAARAGESGKGFAVVAGEVKDLAQETAKATEEIGQRVRAIQADTQGAVESISLITSVIGRIDEFQTTIASAVEEQSVVTANMTRDLSIAADGAGQISSGIDSVAQAAGNTSNGAQAAKTAAAELTAISAELRKCVETFKY